MKLQFLTLCLAVAGFSARAQGPVLLKDINTGAPGAFPANLTLCNGKLFFTAIDGAGTELWVTDGTPAGTSMVYDINPGADSSNPQFLTAFKNKLYFMADNDTSGYELWVSDGTSSGTMMLKNISDDDPFISYGNPSYFAEYNGKLYFQAADRSALGTGEELWVTDGTDTGTKLVKDIRIGSSGSDPRDFTPYNGKLYFSANQSLPNTELWVTDGTGAGTMEVKDINPGSSSAPRYFIVYNNKLYFAANDGSNGTELWVTDGTANGTIMLKDIYPGGTSSYPTNFVIYNNLLYFDASDPTYGKNGKEIWVTDGTSAGTHVFADNTPGVNGSVSYDPPGLPVIYGSRLYWAGNNPAGNGYEVMSTDGTAADIKLLKDINPGNNGSDPSYLGVYNGWLRFMADDGTSGYQLWLSNSTADSTFKVTPSTGGQNSALQGTSDFVAYNGSLYYPAKYSATTGTELYKLTMNPPAPISVARFNALNDLSIYPNPVQGKVYISGFTTACRATVTNLLGQSLQTVDIVSSETVIDMNEYPAGVYILQMTDTNGNTTSRKLLKQ